MSYPPPWAPMVAPPLPVEDEVTARRLEFVERGLGIHLLSWQREVWKRYLEYVEAQERLTAVFEKSGEEVQSWVSGTSSMETADGEKKE